MFQSTPDQLVGRFEINQQISLLRKAVSIHARPIGRAIRFTHRGSTHVPSFNPRPTNWSGDSHHTLHSTRMLLFQSTPDQLVGRFGQFNREFRGYMKFQSTPDQLVGRFFVPAADILHLFLFQSTPDQLVGRLIQIRYYSGCRHGFQSTPDQLVGRLWCRRLTSPRHRCFNPRPTNWSGDSGVAPCRRRSARGFNPRPTNWSGDFRKNVKNKGCKFVSIHARPIGRAIATTPRKVSIKAKFQSTPDQLVGRLRAGTVCGPGGQVSIHARPIGRAISANSCPSSDFSQFQSTPDQLVGRLGNILKKGWKLSCFNPRPTNWSGD